MMDNSNEGAIVGPSSTEQSINYSINNNDQLREYQGEEKNKEREINASEVPLTSADDQSLEANVETQVNEFNFSLPTVLPEVFFFFFF